MASENAETDGGTATVREGGQKIDYLDEEIHIFKPATPFMRDNLKAIFGLFGLWLLFVFGPPVASYVAPEFMFETRVLGGYPLNFFLSAIVTPAAGLVLCAIYAWYRDKLDDKYDITHETEAGSGAAAAADGGEQ